MGMDGVETLNALQWIAELLALGLGIFFAICFVAGFIAGPDKDYYEHLINNHMNDVQRKLDGYIEYDT